MDIEYEMACSRGRNDAEGKAMCRYTKDGKIYTCSAYMAVSGKHPVTGEDLNGEWRCVDQWIPIMLLEGSRTNRGQTKAIESFRNKMMEQNDQFKQLMLEARDARSLPSK